MIIVISLLHAKIFAYNLRANAKKITNARQIARNNINILSASNSYVMHTNVKRKTREKFFWLPHQ